MDILKDIIQRCHKRHGEKLRQRKTVVKPEMYRSTHYRFKVYYARTHSVMLDDLERADISFMPIGHAPENDRGPKDFGGDRFLKRQGVGDWRFRRWFASWGIQIYTGIPSERNGAKWHDLYFTYQAICAAPEAVLACIEELVNTVANPLLTLTKAGGLRFSCRVPDYLHPNTDDAKQYIYKHTPTTKAPYQREVYLEILGNEGYSRWDTRYEILLGDLLNPPVISKEILFVSIDRLRAALHEPSPSGEKPPKTAPVAPVFLGSDNLNLAKAAFVKRGFSYLREDIGIHHWIRPDSKGDKVNALLWEDQGVVWVRATTPKNGLPTRAVPITDVWNDTGITLPITDTGLLVTDKIRAVRKGKLSPLAIKRPLPTLHRDMPSEKVYVTLEEHATQIRRALEQDARILGIISETVRERNYEIEPYLLQGGEICLNVPKRSLAEAAERRYQTRNLPSFVRWRARLYRWEQVKAIPVDERMANPFERGNPCEDPERCRTLDQKGGNSNESICPRCPVYTACQQRGYLSQPLVLRNAKAQIIPTYNLFLDPQHAETLEKIIDPMNGTERICIIDECATEVGHLFLQCGLSKNVLQEWAVSWQGSALGNFAKVLLNAIEPQDEPNVSAITQIRAAIQAFQQHEEEIIMQMCHLNVHGKVVARGMVDADTGQELAHYAIDFEGGVSTYIPLDVNTEDKLIAKGLPFLPIAVFNRYTEIARTTDIEIPMQMGQAIALGILDIETVEKIQQFPTVFKDPNWTFWHQLKRFFAHYKRDADAPMRWIDGDLRFWIPPVLHPNVKRLMLISPKLSGRDLRRIFPGEDIEIVRAEPTAWVPGNQVFQNRTGIYSLHTILNYDSNWDVLGLSKMGERFFFGIRAEIDREPSVKHAIITNKAIFKHLTDLTEKSNVCFVVDFKEIDSVDFEEPEVLWIFGTPHYSQDTIWWQAQMLFGNDDKPLNYEGDFEVGHYKDERIQGVYHQHVTGLLTQAVRYAGLNRLPGKKVVLLTSVALPNITDTPETLLFDWEDFEVAGGLDKLPEVIATRERFEAESAKLTTESSREEVERVLGCSDRQANRVLVKLRGGPTPRVSFREQILAALADGEKRPIELAEIIGGHQRSVLNVLKHLVDIGEVVRVRRGVYKLPEA